MSVILITNHDENISKITEKTSVRHYDTKIVTFKTKLKNKVKTSHIEKSGLKTHATMGLSKESLPDPCTFLKKHTGMLSYTPTPSMHICEKKHRKEQLPSIKECLSEYNRRKTQTEKVDKNFIIKNIKTVMKMKPKEPEPRVVLESHGNSKRLLDGLEPIYIKSDAFGKTPDYLQMFIKKREKIHQMQKEATGVEKPKCHYIRRDEREELLEGLKHNWEELQKQYQGLPILTDTIPKIIRKSKLEAELKQLEKDIVLIERHPYIYVYDDNISF